MGHEFWEILRFGFVEERSPLDHVLFLELALGVQVFLNDYNFLFGHSLLSLLIEHCLFFEEDLLVVMFFDTDFSKDVTLFFVSLSVVNFESIQDPLDVIAFLAEDHSLLVFRLDCEFELELLNAIGLEGDGDAFDAALVR